MAAWLAARARAIRGDAGVLDYAITFPVVMILIAAVFQAALYFAGYEAAISAAQQGTDTGRAFGATVAQGQAAACTYAARAGAGILHAPACNATGGTTVTVTVCGNTLSLLPGVSLRACGQQRAAKERFTTP